MAKLTRWTMPVFAGSAAQDETSVFGTMKTSPEYTSDVAAAIDTQAYNNGWTDAVEIGYAPFLEDMNSLQRAITYQISYNQQQGIPEWASDTEYYKGSVVKLNTESGMQIYSSLVDNNVGNLVRDNTKWKLLIDSANSYVTTNTTQTITGIKTFKGNNRITALQNSNVTYNTAPSSGTHTDISFRDKNGYEMGILEHIRHANNDTSIHIAARGADGNWSSNLLIGRRADGTTYTSAPTPSAGDNSTNIATTAFVKSQGYVSSGNIFPNNTWVPVGDDAYIGDFNRSGAVCIKGNNDNTKLLLINRAQNVDLGFYIDENDNNALKLTSPTYSANAWGSVTAMTAQNLGSNGYVKYNNGLIIQWGKSTATSSSGYVTLPTPFASTDYAVIINDVMANVPPSQPSNANVVGWGVIQSRSTTSFTAFLCNYENSHWWRWDEGRSFTWIAIGY